MSSKITPHAKIFCCFINTSVYTDCWVLLEKALTEKSALVQGVPQPYTFCLSKQQSTTGLAMDERVRKLTLSPEYTTPLRQGACRSW